MKTDNDMAKVAGAETEATHTSDGLRQTDQLTALLAHHQKHDAAEQRLQVVDRAIAGLEQELQTMTTEPSSIAALVRQREDLLASVLVGDATQKQLSDLDAEIEKETAAQAKAVAQSKKKLAETEQALQGLKRKRDSAISEIEMLVKTGKSMTDRALMEEMNMLSANYFVAALSVHEMLVRLNALNQICAEIGIKRSGLMRPNFEYEIPVVNLPGCVGATSINNRTTRGALFGNDAFFDREVSAAVKRERQLWMGAGVTRYIATQR